MDEEKNFQTEYKEIDLMDYMKVIIKRKRLIFGVFLVVLIAVVVCSFFVAPKVYKIDTLIEVGKIGDTLVEEPGQIIGKIEADVYGISVRGKLGISEGGYPRVKGENPENTQLVRIKIEDSRTELAKNILEEINNLILTKQLAKIEIKKKLIEKNIEILKNKISLLGEEKKNLENKEKSLEWLSPYQHITEQLSGSLFTLFDVREKLNTKDQQIENLYLQIDSLQSVLEDVRPTTIVKAPTVSESPLSPKPLLNIIIAAALGVFLGVFLAFGKEWWEKSRQSL